MRSLLPAYKDEERRNKDDYYEHNIQAALLYRMRGNVSRGEGRGGIRRLGRNFAVAYASPPDPLSPSISLTCLTSE
jgi:hypothetical protein